MSVGLLLLLLVPAADPLQQTQQQGGCTATLQLVLPPGPAPEQLALSDSVTLTITVRGPARLDVTVPAPLTRSPGWEVRGDAKPHVETTGERREWRQSWRLSPRQPGSVPLQVEPFRVRETDRAEWRNLVWQPLTLTVTTTVARPDIAELRPSVGPEFLPPEPARWGWWLLSGLAAVLMVGIALVLRRRRRRPLSRSPSFREELARLEREAYSDPEQAARLAERLSVVVRSWLEQTQGLPSRRRTTPECLQALRALPEFPSERAAVIGTVLERCDLARFARQPFADEEWRRLLGQVRELIQ